MLKFQRFFKFAENTSREKQLPPKKFQFFLFPHSMKSLLLYEINLKYLILIVIYSVTYLIQKIILVWSFICIQWQKSHLFKISSSVKIVLCCVSDEMSLVFMIVFIAVSGNLSFFSRERISLCYCLTSSPSYESNSKEKNLF